MNQSNLILKNPPIVEAVLDIECDLPPGQLLSTIEEDARTRFLKHYPTVRKQFIQEHQVEMGFEVQPTLSTRQAIQALQFLQTDEKQLIQIRTQGFSFNRLAPYTNLDDYLAEIERTWRIYLELSKPVQIRLVRLRYINRIELPMSDRRVQLDDYFKVAPRLPEEEKLSLIGFFNQHAAVELGTGNQVNIVLTTQSLYEDKLPIIFDTTVTSAESGDPNDWTFILTKISDLRDLKNRIFKNTLTDKCLDLFR